MADSPSELQLEIEKLERKHAEHPEGRFFVPLANAYRKLGDVETAEALLRAGVEKHPDYLSAHIVLGRCLADRGAVSEAEEEFRFVLAQDPQNLIALRTLGELAAAEGRTGEAAEWYGELLAVDPMNEDARHALEALGDAPASPEAETEFRSGAGWWEPQPETATEGPPPFAEPGWEEEGEERPGAEPDAASAGEPAEEFTRFGGYDDLPGLDEEREPRPQPEPGAETHAELHADGGYPAFEGEETGESEVVTETIAELYARQGLHDRAASVYRELIRRRGGDPALEQRLAEMERLARAEAEEEQEDAGLIFAPGGTEELEVPPSEVAPLAGFEPTAAFEPPAIPVAATGEADPFAASFAGGFAGEEEPETEQPEPEEPETEQPGAREGRPEPEAEPLPSLSESAAAEPTASGSKVTIASFLGELVAWKPAGFAVPAPSTKAAPAAEPPADTILAPEPELEPEVEPEPWGAPVFAPEPGAEPEPRGRDAGAFGAAEEEPLPSADEASLPYLEPVVDDDSLPLLEPHPGEAREHGTGSAEDEEPFPWELPGETGSAAHEPASPARATPEDGFRMEEPEAESRRAVPEEPEPAPGGGGEPGGSGTPSALPDEDEDLESFQAWLRSLKR